MPKKSYLAKRICHMQMQQIGLEEVFFHITETVLVHPKHLEFPQGFVFRRSDVNLHMSVVFAFYFLDLERFSHIRAVAYRQDDGMAVFGQSIDHADAEVAQSGIVGGREPTQQVQDIHGSAVMSLNIDFEVFVRSLVRHQTVCREVFGDIYGA